jgi:hypothetical protein
MRIGWGVRWSIGAIRTDFGLFGLARLRNACMEEALGDHSVGQI